MTDKPVKERLAEILAGDYCPHWFYEENMDEIVAELRRQYEEIEALKVAQYECGFGAGCCYQAAKSEADEALLRQALDCLEWYADIGINVADKTITAIRARLGETA
jgi:hypothetical protein